MTRQIHLIATGALCVLWFSACKKQPESPAASDASPLVGTNRVDTVIATTTNAATLTNAAAITNVATNDTQYLTQAVQRIPEAGSNVATQAKQAAEAGNQQFLSLVQEIQNLIKQNKFAEAGAKLAEFTSMSLTPEQQQRVNQLRAEVEKGISSNAGQAVQKGLSNVLGGFR